MIVFRGAQRPNFASDPVRSETADVLLHQLPGRQQQADVDLWLQRPTLNLSDLGRFSLPVVCQLYQQFLANERSNDSWVSFPLSLHSFHQLFVLR